MTGKQKIRFYQLVLSTALSQGEYGAAREAWTDLMRKGFLPSKKLLLIVMEAMGWKPGADPKDVWATVVPTLNTVYSTEMVEISAPMGGEETFGIVWISADGLQGRRLPLDSCLHVATLALGRQLGGGPRQVVQELASIKRIMPASTSSQPTQLWSSSEEEGSKRISQWRGPRVKNQRRRHEKGLGWVQFLDQLAVDTENDVEQTTQGTVRVDARA